MTGDDQNETGLLFIACALALLFALFAYGYAYPRDLDGRFAASPNREWFQGLRNQKNIPCCDTADGSRVEDPDWRDNGDGTYSIRRDGEWIDVPDEDVVTEPNRVGYAMAWFYNGSLMCFLPGSRS